MKAKDLANLLGVSPATISLVLNNKPGLSDKLRSRLTEQIIELGYGDMLGGKTRKAEKTVKTQGATGREHRPSIAFISYIDQDNEWESIYSFYTGVLEGVQWEARETGCNLVDECASQGCQVLCIGEMGIANTSPSSIWMSLFGNIPLDECIGAGAGLDNPGIQHKREILAQALKHYHDTMEDTTENAIRYFGGFEMVTAIVAMLR